MHSVRVQSGLILGRLRNMEQVKERGISSTSAMLALKRRGEGGEGGRRSQELRHFPIRKSRVAITLTPKEPLLNI